MLAISRSQLLNKPLKQGWAANSVHKLLSSKLNWFNIDDVPLAQELAGRILVLDFWTFGCINSQHMLPVIEKLQRRYKDHVSFISVHSPKFTTEAMCDPIRQAILRYDITRAVINDSDMLLWKRFGIHAWPSLVLVSPLGQIIRLYAGECDITRLEKDIAILQNEYQDYITSPLPLTLEKEHEASTALRFPSKLSYIPSYKGKPAIAVADSSHHQIKLLQEDGTIINTIGSGAIGDADGEFAYAEFNQPHGILYRDGIMYVADKGNHLLREINLDMGRVRTVAGTGRRGEEVHYDVTDALETALASPTDLAFFPSKNEIVIATSGTHQLWIYDIEERTLEIFAGNGKAMVTDGQHPFNAFAQPSGLATYEDSLYVVDAGTSALRKVDDGGDVSTLIGKGLFAFGHRDGATEAASLQHPLGICADASGIYIADSFNNAIRHIDLDEKEVTTLTLSKPLHQPEDIIKVGNTLFISDTNAHQIISVDVTSGEVKRVGI